VEYEEIKDPREFMRFYARNYKNIFKEFQEAMEYNERMARQQETYNPNPFGGTFGQNTSFNTWMGKIFRILVQHKE
jgi:hypothetical protein